ncbi:UBP1-associated protein 2B-like [Phragmites australis]|uniref:UBP1-associated protein 2B-like n=1 Tax=Phragmites australis TaxID=29695 RepID=UPI002D77D747|nr:UBP1-associated protein 2B-like [Phragmites australis]XP_062184610.1 UBP1-associated protein 2B-like [Phragmites australis]
MAPKKRKADPAEPAAAAEPASSEPKPRGTIYFPITDDPPEPTAAAEEDEDGAAGDEDEEEDIGKLLEPLSREQLVALLRTAAEGSPATMAAVRRAAEADPASRKLFVHGLGWGAGADDLRSAFSRFGELEDCRVISDKQSGKSKGYGFVLFRSRRSALRALRRPQLQIGGRLAFCHLAASGPAPPPSQSQNPSSNANTNSNSGTSNNASGTSSSQQPDNMQRKIFVGNVHADVDVDRLYQYFSQFGEIEEGPLGFDKTTGKPKGFALFVYKSVESARRALEEPVRNFDGKMLNVQKAIDGRTKSASGVNANTNSNTTAASAAAAAAAAQMTAPASAAISPYDASAYGATAVPDFGFAQQAAMLGLGAQQQAFAQPNAAMLAMMAAAMQNPAALGMSPAMLALNPAFAAAALGAGGQQAHTAGLAGFGAQGFGVGGAAFPNAAGVQGASATYQGAPPGFQGPPGFQSSAGFQVGQPTTQTSAAAAAAAAAAGAAGYQAGAAGQGQVPGAQIGGTGFQGGY